MKIKLTAVVCLLSGSLLAQTSVTVSTALEFLNAIGSNKTIYLNSGDYVLTAHVGEGSSHVVWENEYDGGQMNILDVTNLKIVGKPGSRILVDPQYTWVMKFNHCSNITLEGYTMGHTNGGYCTGGVVYLDSCANVKVTNCRMFGSGTYGMGIYRSNNIIVEKTDIYKCTYGLLQLGESQNVVFTHTRFRETGEFDQISLSGCKNIHFKSCVFEKNGVKASEYYDYTSYYFFKLGDNYYYETDISSSTSSNITINTCTFRDNTTASFSDDYNGVIRIGDNRFERNTFPVPSPSATKAPEVNKTEIIEINRN